MKKNVLQRALSSLLALVMVLGLVPTLLPDVLAADGEKDPIVLDFLDFAKDVSGQKLWRSLRATNARGVKALGMKYGETPAAKYTEALHDLEKWMDVNCIWSIPDLYDGSNGHYNHPYGARRIYIDSYSGNYGIRLYSDYPGNGFGESRFHLYIDVPTGMSGTYKMLVETFDEAVQSVVPSCDGSDNGGATATFYLNDEQVGEQTTYASDVDEVVERDFLRVNLKEGTNVLRIVIDGDRNGNATAGRCALNLRKISFVDPGPECPHTEKTPNYASNQDKTHKVTVKCDACGEKTDVYDEACADGDDNDTLCDRCGYQLKTRPAPTHTFGKDSIVLDFMQFAYDAIQQDWFYKLKPASRVDGVRAIGSGYSVQPTAEHIQAMKDVQTFLEENYDWTIEDLTEGNPYYTHAYSARRIYIDSLNDYHGIRFYTDLPGTKGSDADRLKFLVTVPKADYYDIDIQSFDEAVPSVIPTYDGPDNGGGCCDIIVNGQVVLEDHIFKNDTGDKIQNTKIYSVYLEEGINSLAIRVKGDRGGPNGYAGRCAINLRYIELIPVGPCQHTNTTAVMVKNERDHTHTVNMVCTCREIVSSTVEDCVDANQDKVCDKCEQPLVLRPAPTKTFPEDSIVLDFKQFAYEAVQQDWWYGLRQSNMNASGKSLGMPYGTNLTAEQEQAFRDADQWMKENLNWRIADLTEGSPNFLSAHSGRHVYMDSMRDDYGIRFYTHLPGNGGVCKLNLAFDVPAGKAGKYAFDLETLNETMHSLIQRHDTWDSGGGTTNIYLNGSLIAKEYVFIAPGGDKGVDTVTLIHYGPVDLVEGENTLTFEVMSDVWQIKQGGRCAFNLNYIEFKPLTGIKTDEYQTAYFDLNEYYMAYGQSAAGFAVEVEDPWIASASINAQGVIAVTGQKTGATKLTVKNGSRVHCIIDVTVGDFTGTLDDLMGMPVKMDFVTTVDRAEEQTWWNGTCAVSAEGDFNTYLKDNAKWHVASGAGITANGDDNTYGFKVKGSNTFNVELPASGLYNVTVEYLRGGGKLDVSLNGKTLYAGLDTAGTAATVKASLGTMELPAGKNTLTVNAASDVYLRSITITPLGVQQTEVGVSRYMDLNETYLPFDGKLEAPVAKSDSEAVEASFNADGILILTGKKVGTANVTVTAGGTTIAVIPVKVIAAGKLQNATYTLDGFTALTMKAGVTAIGDLSAVTTKNTPVTEAFIRDAGDVYFKSSDTSVAKVDQATGDVTTVAEGTAVISAFAMFEGVSVNASVTVTVTDDTDLQTIEAAAPVDYVGIGNGLTMTVSGKKASGLDANMDLYPVAWSVDNDELASIDANGRLTGLKEGTVTVTVTASVNGVAITDSIVIDVVKSTELAGANQFYDFAWSRNLNIQNYTVDANGIAINRQLTTGGGNAITVNSRGIKMDTEANGVLALDVRIDRSGWYEVELRGSSEVNAVLANGYVDDTYIGDIDFAIGGTNHARGGYNTLWLDAGVHTLKLVATEKGQFPFGGVRFYGTSDPNEVEVSMQAGKTQLIPGQKIEVSVLADPANDDTFSLMLQGSKPKFTNYYILSSSDPNVLTVSGRSVTAKAVGEADVVLTGEVDGKEVTKTLTISVKQGTIADVALEAEHTTVKPDAETFPLTLVAKNLDGKAVALPAGATVTYESADESVAKVDANGNVTVQGKEASALITATVKEGERVMTAQIWITATMGKTKPTIWTYEERATAQENALKYDWAWAEKEAAVARADMYVAALDSLYEELLHPQTWPGNNISTFHNSSFDDSKICPICEFDLTIYNGYYPWKVDPVNNPWKIQCPHCGANFPSNDFESYYRSGLGEDGRFHEELADKQYLVNELYPEKGEDWGVDDGWGWYTGKKGSNNRAWTYTFISHYIRKATYPLGDPHQFLNILDYLGKAYMYTGDEKYGNAGAILTDRLADIYPTWDISDFPIEDYSDCDGNGGGGYQFGETWDGEASRFYAKAADAFWPCMDNPEVIDYIAEHAAWKGLTAEDITPDYVRNNVDENLLLHIWEGLQTANVTGNFGIPQAGAAYTAVALDRLPESQDIIDWLFRYKEFGGSWLDDTSYMTGGGLLTTYVGQVKRDGLGNEGSLSYNSLWEINNVETFNALNGYERIPSADMWKNSKVVTMFHSAARLMTSQYLGVNLHETSGAFQHPGMAPSISRLTTAFVNTGDHTIARALYAFNNNSTEGIHGDIFTKDPEHGIRSRIEEIVKQDGEWEMGKSDMMPGYGMAFLREGPAKHIRGVNDNEYGYFTMYYGDTFTDHHKDYALHFDVAAFGLNLSADLGYPLRVDSNPERLEWIANTVSGNTVVVNDRGQMKIDKNGFPEHFADDGKAKVMDADVPHVYAETDIYRRTVVAVDNGDGVHYAVDFFRVLGGNEHVYSFHAASMTDPVVSGLTMVEQPMGTYAGPEVPFGPDPTFETTGGGAGSGYSWLYNVARDDNPDTVFSLDWPIMDHWNQYPSLNGVHLKLTMVSEEPMAEVATADGNPPQDGENPGHLEYVLIRKSGTDGMDTLFTSIIEPYQYNSYIAAAELVDMELISGTEGVTDRAAAMKVTLTSGRVDYIVYATNTECTYRVADLFNFKGFTGVVSYEDGLITYAWGEEATIVTDLITNAQPRITGEVLSFTEGLAESYEMTVSMDRPVDEDLLVGKWIYVDNDHVENAAYRIDGIDITGNTAKIDLSFQSLIRGYVDEKDLDKGMVHNIAVGDTYNLPLTVSFDEGQLFHHVSDTVVKTGSKLSAPLAVTGSGATYELEGAPAGMKLDAAGILTWSPAKAQAGRYPIGVKAVKDGKVIGETSFVIYAVAYSGSSYAEDVCVHSKAVTYEVDGVIETICPACGKIEKTGEEEVIEKFDIAGANMTLGNELKLNILVENEKLGDGDYTVKITHDGQTVEKALEPYNSSYAYAAYSVCAKQMSDVITAEVYKDGVAVSNVYETSVRNYAMNILNNPKLGVKVKTLVVDMLNYGAEAQKFFGYNASDLANARLNAAQKDLATKAVECKNYQVKGTNFYGSNVSLEDRIILNLFFKNCADGMTATVSYTGYDGTAVSVDAQLVQYKNDIYKVAIDEIVLADAFSPVTVTVYKDGAEFGSATDSIESYVARTGDSAINEAIMKFAYSAKQYLG